jgi:HK97 family phage portal protein
MDIFGFKSRRMAKDAAESRASPETESVAVSSENFLAFFGVQAGNVPNVTIDNALNVPAVFAAVAFLSRTLAALPRHAYRSSKDGAKRVGGKLETVVNMAPNGDTNSFKFWQYFWTQVFTGGRGLAWIERTPQGIEALWGMDPSKTTVKRTGFSVTYEFEGKTYPASDVIDVPFMLQSDGLKHYGPITKAAKAIQLALAMNDYGSNFFAGGGVPPLALEGPLPSGAEAMKRAMADIHRAIDEAKKSEKPVFPMPPGHKLTQVGYDPAKGQMIEARRFQIEEIARAWQLPPVFLQDLSRATFTNAEQQDLHLVKHLIGQWAKALEDEMNLKMFGRGNNGRWVEHALDGLMRGDFKSRIEGIARAIQTAQMTPNEARALENRPAVPNGDDLLVQGATVPLGSQPVLEAGKPPQQANDNQEDGADAA